MNTQQQKSRYQTGHKGAKEESKWQGVGEAKTEGQRGCVHVCQSWFQSNHQLNGYVLGGHPGSDPDIQRQKKRVNDRGVGETKTEGQRKCVHVCQSWFQSNHQLSGCVMDNHAGSDPDRERCGPDTMTGMLLGVPAYLWKPAGQTGRFSGREGHDQSLLPQLSQGQGIPVQHNHTIITWGYLCNTTTATYHWVYLCNTTTTKYHLGVPVQHNHNKISPVQHNNISPVVPVQHN